MKRFVAYLRRFRKLLVKRHSVEFHFLLDKYKIGEKRRKGLPEDLDQLLASAGVAKQPKQSESATVSHYSQLDQLSSNSPRNYASESSAAASAGIRFFNPGESRR